MILWSPRISWWDLVLAAYFPAVLLQHKPAVNTEHPSLALRASSQCLCTHSMHTRLTTEKIQVLLWFMTERSNTRHTKTPNTSDLYLYFWQWEFCSLTSSHSSEGSGDVPVYLLGLGNCTTTPVWLLYQTSQAFSLCFIPLLSTPETICLFIATLAWQIQRGKSISGLGCLESVMDEHPWPECCTYCLQLNGK